MTDIEKLGANERIYRGYQKELRDLKNTVKPVDPKHMLLFPGKDEPWVRATMITAREADLVNFKSLIDYYRELCGISG